MRMFTMFAVAVAVAIVAIGFGVKTMFVPRPLDDRAMATSKTISPHEIHLNYKAMKKLPDNEVKEPF